MTTFKKFTKREYEKAVAEAKAQGNKVVGYLWDGVEFEKFIIRRVVEVK